MTDLSPARLRRVLRKPPRYLAWRLADEARVAVQQRELALAAAGRGRLTPERLRPSERALAQVDERAAALGAWETAAAATRADERLAADLRDRAADARARRVELFGDAPVAVGTPPDWLADAHSGHAWPLGAARRLDYVNRGRPSDVKVPWELSRMRHLVALAQAVATDGDAEAEAAIGADLESWEAANPLGWSVNWAVGMEVGLRAVNLACVHGMLAAAGRGEPARRRLAPLLYRHGWFLARNLEVSDVNGNHYLANAVGLLWLGRLFAGTAEGDRWRATGARMATAAAREQILDDGLDHEGSLPYHWLVLELFLLALHAAPDELAGTRPALMRMAAAAEAVIAPNGEVPDLGDDDGGRVLAFCAAPSRDGRRVLALAGALLGRPAPPGDAWPQDALWLTGDRPNEVAADPPARPAHLAAGGVVVLGDGTDHVVVDTGPVGFRGRGGHGHLDATSFVAWLSGEPVVRDSGTATYTGDPELRNRLRAVEAHTTVVVDELPYAKLGGTGALWAVEGDAPPRVVALEGDAAAQTLVLEQTLPAAAGQAVLRRTITWAPGRLEWTDRVEAPPGAGVRATVQLPGGAALTGERALAGSRARYEVTLPPGGELAVTDAEASERYGSLTRAPRAVVTFTGSAEISWRTWVS